MSHAYYHKKPKGQNIDITVTFRYHGLKATQHFAKFTPQSLQVIRDDALQLRIPHPKSDNVTLVTHGQVEFSWFDVESYGVLHKNLLQKLRPSDPAQQESLKQLLVELSM
ncbi:hypothetical protein BKA70DRAFT_480271 [Coprinopsis sp. MPI-PUGE-AT-0042]|nr:hypothetical protein BKA70DRAFT_480271 [Coprinopsis sp. MPI-PUGE-AT-0042]